MRLFIIFCWRKTHFIMGFVLRFRHSIVFLRTVHCTIHCLYSLYTLLFTLRVFYSTSIFTQCASILFCFLRSFTHFPSTIYSIALIASRNLRTVSIFVLGIFRILEFDLIVRANTYVRVHCNSKSMLDAPSFLSVCIAIVTSGPFQEPEISLCPPQYTQSGFPYR